MIKGQAAFRSLTLILCLALARTGQGRILYVDRDAPSPNDGSSWSSAYWCLQDALKAALNGDEIRVAEGIYKPDQQLVNQGGRKGLQIIASGDRAATFQLINGVTLKGGYAGFGQDDPNARDLVNHQSILSGDLAHDDAMVENPLELFLEPTRQDNSYHVVTADRTDSTTVLDGFVVAFGSATDRAYLNDSGGGIRNIDGSPKISNCFFYSNIALSGGGTWNYRWNGTCNPVFVNCTFEQNAAAYSGGAVDNRNDSRTQDQIEMTNCVIKDNFCAGSGGGMASNTILLINDCTFSGNSGIGGGGGMICGGNTTITNCTFTANSTMGDGGGLAIGSSSEANVTDCSFTENTAVSGAGLAIVGGERQNDRVVVTNCTFIRNSASDVGGGFHGGAGAKLINCTFIENSTKGWGGGGVMFGNYSLPTTLVYGYPALENCTFRGNSSGGGGGGLYASNSKVVGCTFEGNTARRGSGAEFRGLIGPLQTEWKNCTFRNNTANELGGGLYVGGNLTLSKCTFEANISHDSGGGLHRGTEKVGEAITIDQCIFTRNSAFTGGAISVQGSNHISNCIFNGNSATDVGCLKFIETPKTSLVNCTITGNTAKSGAVLVRDDNSYGNEISLVNCTLTANVAQQECIMDLPWPYEVRGPTMLYNCILWNNRDNSGLSFEEQAETGKVTARHCSIEGWTMRDGNHNINTDPLFVRDPNDGGDGWVDDPNTPDIDEAANNNYGVLWLHPESPCINAGDGAFLPADTLDLDRDGDRSEPIPFDLDGAQRILGNAVDIGAYEHHKDFVIHVDDDAPGANNGSNWYNAYHHLQDALARAESAVKPVLVLVADGVYTPDQGANQTPGDRTASFHLMNWVTLKGGYAGFIAPDPNLRDANIYKSILSGDLNRNDIVVADLSSLRSEPTRSENSYHVVIANETDSTAVLDGFVITAGNASGPDDYGKGGGLYAINSNPTITDCVLTGNSAVEGAGMYNRQSSSNLRGCLFSNNAALHGAGLFNSSSASTLTDCTVKANLSQTNGGAVCNSNQSNAELIGCVLTDNRAGEQGGAIHNDNSDPILKDCTMTRNVANHNGGGLCNIVSSPTLTKCRLTKNVAELGGALYNDQSSPIVTNCVFSQNVAHERGGGMFNSFISAPTVTNCRFGQNRAGKRGGALFNHASSAAISNCTITGNSADWEGGGICNVDGKLSLVNCILWANSAQTWAQLRSYGTTVNLIVSNCVIQGGLPPALMVQGPSTTTNSNLDLDPYLTADQHIQFGSPCIDAGDNNAVPADNADLDGDLNITESMPVDTDDDPRFSDEPDMNDTGTGMAPVVDIGADEFVDSDGDLLPDWWEKKYFEDALVAGPNDDPDADTLTNLEEYEFYSSNPIAAPLLVDASSGAYRTIQEGIDAAEDGDTVLLAAGTYTGEGNRNIDFRGKSAVLKALDGPDITVIDCEEQARGFNFHSGEGPSAAIIGIKITRGKADYGGAVSCERSHPQLRDCIIADNNDPNHGVGGIYGYLSHPTLADCTIHDNNSVGIQVEYGSIGISGTVELSDEWAGQNVMLYGNGTLEMSSDSVLLLDHSSIRCNVRGAGTIQVGLNANLVIEKDALVDLGVEQKKGTIECHGLLRVKDNAKIMNANVNITRASFEGDVNVSNSVITAEAGAPYGQFFVEDSVIISDNEIHADGDRYMDMDRSVFDGLLQNNRIYITITEGKGQTRGGLFELRGRDGLVSTPCGLGEFLCKANPDSIPACDPNSWTIEELHLADWAKLNLTNRFDFQPPFDSGGESEVLYVKNLVLDEGAVLNTAFNRIYYENLSLAANATVKNIPLLGFSLNMIAFNDQIEFSSRVSHNNSKHPINPDFDRIHVQRVSGIEPDPQGMMRMRNIKDSDPESSQYGEVINARAKGLFAKSDEDQILVLFEYLFETSNPGTELVISLSDEPELLDSSNPAYAEHYLEVARLAPPPAGQPGSAGRGRFGTFYKYVSRDYLDFVKGTRIELELIGPDGASVLINNWDPQVHCSGICMDLNWSNAPDEEDFLLVIGEYGTKAELLGDGTGSRACLDGVFSTDGYVDSYDIMSWDWALSDPDRSYRLNMCQVPISSTGISVMSSANSWLASTDGPISPTDLTNSLSDLLIVGKRSMSEDPYALKSKDRLYLFDRAGQYAGWSEPTSDRGNIRLVKGPNGKLYQINSEKGIVRLDGSGNVIVPTGQATYANDPRFNKPATIHIGIQDEGVAFFGRPILDAAFDGDYVYVVPAVVSPEGEQAYLAAAKLRLLSAGNPPYQVVQIYDDPPATNDNQQRDNLREVEIDDDGNIYVVNVHSINESDILWKYSSNGILLRRLDLGNPKSSSYLPDPTAMHVSDVTDRVYLTSGQSGQDSYTATIYGFSKENLALEKSVTINGMNHVTGITEDPSTGTLWVVGFNMADIPDYPNPTQAPFYYPCLASIPSGSDNAQVVPLLGSYDLGLPMSIVWTGRN